MKAYIYYKFVFRQAFDLCCCNNDVQTKLEVCSHHDLDAYRYSAIGRDNYSWPILFSRLVQESRQFK